MGKAGRAEGMEDHELTPHIETLYNQSVRTKDRMKKLSDGKWDAFGIPYGLKEKLVEILEEVSSDSEEEEYNNKSSKNGSPTRHIKGDNFSGSKTIHDYGGVKTIDNSTINAKYMQ